MDPPSTSKTRIFKHPNKMGRKCVICGAKPIDWPERKFHAFPKHPSLSDKWAAITKNKRIMMASPNERNSRYRVCSHHFADEDYLSISKIRFRNKVAPHLNIPSSLLPLDICKMKNKINELLKSDSMKSFRKPSDLFDATNPDWAPSVDLGFKANSKIANDAAINNRSEHQELQTSKLTVQPANAIAIDDAEISNTDTVDGSMSLKTTTSLTPGNAHIIRVIPITFENNKVIEQDSKSEIELLQELKESDLSEDEGERDISEENEEEHNSYVKEETLAKIPETEVVTYLVCDANQQLDDFQKFIPNLSQDNSVKLTENLQLKEASNISNIIQAIPLISKIVERKSRVPNDELKEKTDLVFKVSILESKIARFQEQHKKDKKRIKALLQKQRRTTKNMAALKEYVNVLKKLKDIAHAKSEILNGASPSLIQLLDRQKCQNKDKTVHNEYSLEVREFVKTLYSISPDAYRYVRNYFDQALPHETTLLKWISKGINGLVFNFKDDFSGLNSENCIDEDCAEVSFQDVKVDHINGL